MSLPDGIKDEDLHLHGFTRLVSTPDSELMRVKHVRASATRSQCARCGLFWKETDRGFCRGCARDRVRLGLVV